MLTVVDIQPIADALLRNWQAMDPATRDPDYPQSVYDLAREYANELVASQAASEADIAAAVASGAAGSVVVAYDQALHNAQRVAAGLDPAAPVTLEPGAEFVYEAIPYVRGPTESTEGAPLPPGYQLLPGETIQEAMSRRFKEVYPEGIGPPASGAPTMAPTGGGGGGGGAPSYMIPDDPNEVAQAGLSLNGKIGVGAIAIGAAALFLLFGRRRKGD